MKRTLCFVLVFLMALAFARAEKGDGFKVVLFTLAAGTMADYAITTHALSTGMFAEGNKLASWYVGKPAIAVPIILGITAASSAALYGLYKKNKTVAYILAGTLFLVRGYVIYHNLRLIARTI